MTSYEKHIQDEEEANEQLCTQHALKYGITNVYQYMDDNDVISCEDEMPCKEGCPLIIHDTR